MSETVSTLLYSSERMKLTVKVLGGNVYFTKEFIGEIEEDFLI